MTNLRIWWRAAALAGVSIALLFAVRDTIGFSDAVPVSSDRYEFYRHLWGFIRLLMLFVAATVAWWGGHRRQARILASALIGMSFNNNWWFYGKENPLIWPSVSLNYLGLSFGLAQFLLFAATYGEEDWRDIRRYIAKAAPYIGGLVAIFGTAWWISLLVFGWWQPLFNQAFWASWDLVNVLAITASVIGARCAKPNERMSIIWVAASFSIAAFGTAIHGIDRAFQGDTYWANTFDTLAQAALPLGLGYAVLRHRALDIDFLINRALLFGFLSFLLAIAFALAEVLTHDWLASLPFLRGLPAGVPENIVGLGLSVGVVLSYKRLEKKTEQIVERWRGRVLGLEVKP